MPASLLLLTLAWLAQDEPAASRPESKAPAALAIEFTVADGSRTFANVATRCEIVVRNQGNAAVAFELEAWLPPELRFEGLAAWHELAPRGSCLIACTAHVEPDRPAGPLRFELVARARRSNEVLARHAVVTQSAVGREFVRLSFESPVRAPWFERKTTGAWAASVERGDAACGARRLRIVSDEGGRGECVLLHGGASFSSAAFPFVTCALRARAADRVAPRMRVGTRALDLPFAHDGEWHRVTVRLPETTGNVDSLALVLEGAAGARLEVDDLAIVRDDLHSAADELRDLCERWVEAREADGRVDIGERLAAIDTRELAGADLVDSLLLAHAVALAAATRDLPIKKAGEPAGEARFLALLRHQQMIDDTPAQLIVRGWDAVKSHQAELARLAEEIAPGKSWREVVNLLEAEHPAADAMKELAERNWHDARDFTIAERLVTVPLAARHGVIQLVTDGPLSKTYAFGGYGGASASPHGYTGRFLVSPPATWMNDEEKAQRLRGNHFAWCRVVALHEMVPGHHLQTVVHEMRPLSAFRRRFYSTLFAEGWALYCEQMLAKAGYLTSPKTRFAHLQMRLWRAARVIMDCSLHTGRMSKDEAVKLFVDEAALEPESARAEIARDVDAPTRPLSYYLGCELIEELERDARRKLGERFDARAFRDRLLAFGPIPIAAVRKGMGL